MSKKATAVFTENFFDNLDVIKEYYKKNNSLSYFSKLTNLLFNEFFPLLETQPNMGRPLQTKHYLTVANQLRLKKIKEIHHAELQELFIEHFCVLYIIIQDKLVVLSIKDQKNAEYAIEY